jgi:hypothetical protein
MYNFDNQIIPLHLPMLEGVQLQPWFTTAIIDEGLQIIRDKKISGFSCIRNATGALVGKTARVHRMGQKNVVQMFRLIAKGTLEEKIHNLISKKRNLATSLIQEDEAGIIKQMDRRQLAELFCFTPAPT